MYSRGAEKSVSCARFDAHTITQVFVYLIKLANR